MSASKKQSACRRAALQRKTRSFDAIARAAVAAAQFVPEVTDILTDRDDYQAMIEAFITERCNDESKKQLRVHAKAARESDYAHSDIVWVREEIAYALGVEVGRRLAGGAR